VPSLRNGNEEDADLDKMEACASGKGAEALVHKGVRRTASVRRILRMDFILAN
jgi:hypothetical protein